MSYIRFGNKLITTSIQSILEKIRFDTHGAYLHDIKTSNNDLRITCPFHSEGKEKTPDCFINNDNSSDLYGVFHCFACGKKGYISDIVNQCFGQTGTFGQNWLIENFSNVLIETQELLPEIDLSKPQKIKLDESSLDKYKYFHPYMFKRKLSEDIIRKFSVGYDAEDDTLVFPVWDENNNLVFITKRSVKNKYFYIPSGVIKPVYLLNFIINEHITKVMVCESQINALYCWSMGYPAIALFGTGSKEQYDILKRSGIRNFILCFDGDVAGDNGIKRFVKNMSDEVLISVKKLPRGKDVNDLTKDEFDNLECIDF